MRPVGLQLKGFSVYRSGVEVDFDDVDFFSLSGPTGSGKSSLVDAMIFALFGRVPRLGGNAVAPVITAGAEIARVRFDFEVDGDRYTAVRMAQRTAAGGASVREARLQRGESVLADGAEDVTRAVESLLRLRFDDFTRTVVLPQGDFARFLTATRAERQTLLRALLGLDVYTKMRELAKTREAVSRGRADVARSALESLEVVGDEEMEAIQGRVTALEDLTRVVAEAEGRIADLGEKSRAADTWLSGLQESVERLEAVTPPEQLEGLAGLEAEARAALADVDTSRAELTDDLAAKEAKLRDLPSAERVERWASAIRRRADLKLKLDGDQLLDAEQSVERADAEIGRLVEILEVKTADLERARNENAAVALAGGLQAGESCPVCRQVVTRVPEHHGALELDDLELAVAEARERMEAARSNAGATRTEHARLVATHGEWSTQLADLEEELDEGIDAAELERLTTEIRTLTTEIDADRKRLGELESEAKRRRARLEDLYEASRRVARALTETQIGVAALDPPISESDDVVVQWKELMHWRSGKLEELEETRQSAEEEVSRLSRLLGEERQALDESLKSMGVPLDQTHAVAVSGALHSVRARLERLRENRKEAERLNGIVDTGVEEAEVANALAGHLRANGFEQWLMAGALADLTNGANELLDQLSGGGYSLRADETGDFTIVDHRNADEVRSVATLSGGETFLVSLALALSLAETLSAKGGSGLDAIILDEGFGTLDEESLDTVATVLEELTGRGLMVGVITHVKELAARAPVRYLVTRGAAGADVEKMS